MSAAPHLEAPRGWTFVGRTPMGVYRWEREEPDALLRVTWLWLGDAPLVTWRIERRGTYYSGAARDLDGAVLRAEHGLQTWRDLDVERARRALERPRCLPPSLPYRCPF